MDHKKFMRLAIKEAKKAFGDGEKNGIGAILIKDGKVVGAGHNNAKITGDPTSHAEINAIRDASKRLKTHNLNGCVLFTTCEPCPMCFTAAWWARVSKIVFGANLSEVIKFSKRQINVNCEFLNENGTYQLEISGGFMRDECLKLFK